MEVFVYFVSPGLIGLSKHDLKFVQVSNPIREMITNPGAHVPVQSLKKPSSGEKFLSSVSVV